MKKIIISVAPVKAGTPIDADRLAADVEKCVQAGASVCHLHCRKPDGSLTPDITFFSECFDKILAKTDVIVQTSTGGVSDLSIEQRCNPLDYAPTEMASLNGGTTNLWEDVYINSMDDIRYCASAVYKRNILPETEVFDIGMLHNMAVVAGEQPFHDPVLYNLVFGHLGGLQATTPSLSAFASFVPAGQLFGVTHFGRDNWTFLAAAIASGASLVRIGFEDSNYLDEGLTAMYNYQLVERLAGLIHAMGLEVATPEETRAMLNLKGRQQ